MTELNKDNLEKALSSDKPKKPQMPKDVEIGFHQGALNTLINERNELIKVIMQTEQVMQAHMKRLEELGIKIQKSPEKK